MQVRGSHLLLLFLGRMRVAGCMMQEPLVEDRMSAGDALRILRGEASPAAIARCVFMHLAHLSTGPNTDCPAFLA